MKNVNIKIFSLIFYFSLWHFCSNWYCWDDQFWKYFGLYWFILSTIKGWDYIYEFLEVRDGDFFTWKSEINSPVWDWCLKVVLRVDEEDEDSVVIGEGINFVIWGRFCGEDYIGFLSNGFFLASSSCSLIQ